MNWEQLYLDFRQKYEGCYCQVLLEGYKQSKVFLLDFLEKTNAAPLLHLVNDEFGEVILKYDDSHSDVVFDLPPIGLYNYKQSVVMVRRLYSRQFRRGICSATIVSFPIYSGIYPGFNVNRESLINEQLVTELSKPTHTISLKEGINALEKNLAIALNKEFALGLSVRDAGKDYVLWYYENPIGTVDPVARRIFLRETQFQQEFMDFVSSIKGTDDYSFHS